MFVLAIESSCDETSLAIFEVNNKNQSEGFLENINSYKVVSSVISSQIKIHALYGGVVPEIGAREHAECIHSLFDIVLTQAAANSLLSKDDILQHFNKIFVTTNPGLTSALKVGMEFAKSLSFYIGQIFSNNIEVVAVDHLEGHVASCFFDLESNSNVDYSDEVIFPHLHLLVSGGNSQLRLLRSFGDQVVIGQTLDDAAGECFDKAARMIGLDYPGGAMLSKIAGSDMQNPLDLPVSMLTTKSCDFSFSGLKTAVRYKIQKSNIDGIILEKKLTQDEINSLLSDISNIPSAKLIFLKKLCISVQFAILTQIINKTRFAFELYKPKSIGLSGGVSANRMLRIEISNIDPNMPVFIPHISLTGDNAVMIGLAGLSKQIQ